ncbi:MAG: GNAT family N-acetyltransferase [Candidatus Methanomethylophilaceae archaeon]|jgi:ribosomal-protein-alanine N-acetyltransferase|nr:GNAT family N-acetyltransferase [Candidatus Methanomethylophilaceae archaeon]
MIRPMRRDDLNDLYDITLMSLDEAFLPDVFFGFYQQWPEGQFVSCDFLNKAIGFLCSVRLMDGGARVMMFAMHPNYRGRGKGTELLNALMTRARMEGIRYITLEVREENLSARKFYKGKGFIEVGTLERYYSDGGSAIRMDLFLS